MNKLELFLESIIDKGIMEVSSTRLAFQNKDLYFLFQRNISDTHVWLDCSWVEANGKRHPTSYLRFDFPSRTIQGFLEKYTHTTPESKHHLVHPRSVATHKNSIILPVYEAFVQAINDNPYPVYKNSILRNKIDNSLGEKPTQAVQKI